MPNQKQALGKWGEDCAARFLEEKGYAILERNIHTPHGEIDLLATRDEALIFVEVKTRSSHWFAYPEDSVNRRKQTALLSAAEAYLQAHPESSATWQFDVIAVERKPAGKPEILHFENVLA